MPRARDSGDLQTPSHIGGPDSAFRQANNVGNSQRQKISELILTACFLAVYASHPPVARRMATLASGLPATALTGLDSHQLDSNKGFTNSSWILLSCAFLAR